MLRDCPVTGKIDLDWRRLLSGDKISICRLNEVRWKRKREETTRLALTGVNVEGPEE